MNFDTLKNDGLGYSYDQISKKDGKCKWINCLSHKISWQFMKLDTMQCYHKPIKQTI